jgi:hypothetical protein
VPRQLIAPVVALALALTVARSAHADDAPVAAQEIGAELGLATGGHLTPGGLHLGGRFLYQLAQQDWFDGAASFTYGGGPAQCYLDRAGQVACSHDFADGQAFEISAGVRRIFDGAGAFRPFARVGVGLKLARFPADNLSGFALPLHGGGGVRVRVAPSVAVVAFAELELGLAVFGRGVGLAPQLGFVVGAGAEFPLR